MPLKRNADGLTPRELRFAQEYLVDQNAMQAAIRVGHKPANAARQGFRYMGRESIKVYIARQTVKVAAKLEINAEFIIMAQVEVLNGAVADKSWAAANGALANLSRHFGMFNDKIAVNMKEVSEMSPVEVENEMRRRGILLS